MPVYPLHHRRPRAARSTCTTQEFVAAQKTFCLSSLDVSLDEDTGLYAGEIVWATRHCRPPVALRWSWAEIQPGVVVIADIHRARTTCELVDEGGCALSASQRLITVHTVIHALPWQAVVLRNLDGRGAPDMPHAA